MECKWTKGEWENYHPKIIVFLNGFFNMGLNFPTKKKGLNCLLKFYNLGLGRNPNPSHWKTQRRNDPRPKRNKTTSFPVDKMGPSPAVHESVSRFPRRPRIIRLILTDPNHKSTLSRSSLARVPIPTTTQPPFGKQKRETRAFRHPPNIVTKGATSDR